MGLAPMAGGTGAAATVKVTGTVTGVTPVAATERHRPAIGAHGQGAGRGRQRDAAIAGAACGESVNQVAFSLAVQVKVPPPVLLMLRVCVAGLAPP